MTGICQNPNKLVIENLDGAAAIPAMTGIARGLIRNWQIQIMYKQTCIKSIEMITNGRLSVCKIT